jgi:hypothetical protein
MKTEQGTEYYGHVYKDTALLEAYMFLLFRYEELNKMKATLSAEVFDYNDVCLQLAMHAVETKFNEVNLKNPVPFVKIRNYIHDILNENSDAIEYLNHAISFFDKDMQRFTGSLLQAPQGTRDYNTLKSYQTSTLVIIVCLRDLLTNYGDGVKVDDSFNFHKDSKHSGHDPIITFFKRHSFGTNNPVLTYLSVLAPVDRCVILEGIFNPNFLNSTLSDKLLLAYVTSGKQHLAEKVIENSIKNGENEMNVWGLKSKLDLGLAPTRNRTERLKIYNDFLSTAESSIEKEFLNLLITFCNNHYD